MLKLSNTVFDNPTKRKGTKKLANVRVKKLKRYKWCD